METLDLGYISSIDFQKAQFRVWIFFGDFLDPLVQRCRWLLLQSTSWIFVVMFLSIASIAMMSGTFPPYYFIFIRVDWIWFLSLNCVSGDVWSLIGVTCDFFQHNWWISLILSLNVWNVALLCLFHAGNDCWSTCCRVKCVVLSYGVFDYAFFFCLWIMIYASVLVGDDIEM